MLQWIGFGCCISLGSVVALQSVRKDHRRIGIRGFKENWPPRSVCIEGWSGVGSTSLSIVNRLHLHARHPCCPVLSWPIFFLLPRLVIRDIGPGIGPSQVNFEQDTESSRLRFFSCQSSKLLNFSFLPALPFFSPTLFSASLRLDRSIQSHVTPTA